VEWYEEEVRAIERADRLKPPEPGRSVFYGSSSFRLWDDLPAAMAPFALHNRAFGGSTLAACEYFFERLVPPCAPRALVLYAGDNDLGDGHPPEAVIRSLTNLVARAERRLGPLPLGFVSIKPSPARWELRRRIAVVNEAARHLCVQRRNRHFIDVGATMLDAAGLPRVELFAEDGLHLSAAGYALWGPTIREALATMLCEGA
jgi:lysophospholipase L1-like esterase